MFPWPNSVGSQFQVRARAPPPPGRQASPGHRQSLYQEQRLAEGRQLESPRGLCAEGRVWAGEKPVCRGLYQGRGTNKSRHMIKRCRIQK